MQYDTLRLSYNDNVAVIEFTRPDVMNALNTQMRAEILHAVKQAEKEARVLDLERTLRDEYVPMLMAIYNCKIPTISAVNGAAAGAGANLALAADVVIATQSAVFLQAFTRIGLIPDAGGSYYLPRQVGLAKAMGAALFAEPLTADQASAMGMIWESVPDAEFDAKWRGRASHLANGPTEAYARVKKIIRASFENDLEKQLMLEAKLQGECGKTHDFKEGVMAFLDKRAANYEGR
jgi:2-(1,2-epoxy-1,2-dihydrophenyl)acetyl-CoA isomerase